MLETLRITEIFHSIQGEANTAGRPTVFIRLTGCPLRCVYCDTEYAFSGGEQRPIEGIISAVEQFKTKYITVTGGEPLAQKNVHLLMKELCDRGFIVSLETSGALSTGEVDPRVIKVVDFKTPDSGELDKNDYSNIELLNPQDQVKYVICSEKDYQWAKKHIIDNRITGKVGDVLLSPSAADLEPIKLAEWILEDQLDVRMQLQLHKLIWGDKQGV